jgi:hypothetical protein
MKLVEMDEDARTELFDEVATLGAICALRAWDRSHRVPALLYRRMTDEDERDFNEVLAAYGVEYDPMLKAVFWAGAAGEDEGLAALIQRERGN